MDFLMRFLKKYFPVYLLVVSLFVGSATIMTRTVTAIAEALPIPRNVTIVIDPGHGGEDGGADLLHRDPGEPAQSGDFPASPGPIAFWAIGPK
ncbi:MAG: hypothetical protein ACLSHU_05605 [Oscillospiraceae bacterium]